MVIQIEKVLTSNQLSQVIKLVSAGRFVDGRLSAGKEASSVKNNQELSPDKALSNDLNQVVMGSLVKNYSYQIAAFPHRVAAPFYARYTKGMSYGKHIDDPVMGAGDRYRSDIAITIFLSGPDDYSGGELAIGTSFGEQLVKLAAGDAVLYPASSLHEVREVTSGERLVAVTWAQSMVRDPAQREILFNLCRARDRLLEKSPEEQTTALVSQSYVNLLRMWSEL